MLLRILCLVAALAGLAQGEELVPGQVTTGTVSDKTYTYYEVPIPASDELLTVTVTPQAQGDPDLYCAFDPNPTKQNNTYSADVYGEDSVNVESVEYTGQEKLYCGVYGWRGDNSFTIVASFKSTVALQLGTPQSGSLVSEAEDKYSITLDDDTITNLTLSITETMGYVSVLVSTNENPTEENSQWGGNGWNTGSPIIIRKGDTGFPETFPATLYVLVSNSALPATYQLVASAAGEGANGRDTVTLRDGIPHTGLLETQEFAYFEVSVLNAGCNLDVSLTPVSGDPDLFACVPGGMCTDPTTPGPEDTDNDRKSVGTGIDQISFADAQLGSYYIAVGGFRAGSYSIVAHTTCDGDTHDNNYIQLTNGVGQSGHLDATETRYYRITMPMGSPAGLRIATTAKFGDPDIFVTTDANPNPPSRDNEYWKSTGFGADILDIPAGDESGNFCTGCVYYIAVVGFTETAFTLTATAGESVVNLQDNVPFKQALVGGTYEYFRLYVDDLGPRETITVSVTTLNNGDPDLFMSTDAASPPEGTTRPNRTANIWESQNIRGDSITIGTEDANYCVGCSYYIGVYAFRATNFTIIATREQEVQLQNGIPQSGYVPKEGIDYFTIQVPQDSGDLTVALSSVNGATTLYVSSTGQPNPDDNTSYQWVAYSFTGQKSVTISDTDADACMDISCVYTIAVFGDKNSTYKLVASTAAAVIPLQTGVPQSASVARDGYAYFSFTVADEGLDLSFECTPLNGDPDMYVSRNTTTPTKDDFQDKSNRFGADIVDYVPAEPGTYYVGINAYTDSSFTVMALLVDPMQEDTSVVTLIDGQPQSGLVVEGEYRYYQFTVHLGSDVPEEVLFTSTSQFGDPDLYVSKDGSLPTKDNAWMSSTNGAADVVRITEPEPGTTYTVGVYAYRHMTSFTLTASTGGGAVTVLQDGVSVPGVLSRRSYKYYKVLVDDPSLDLTVSVTMFSGDADLYINSATPGSDGHTLPTKDEHEWKAIAYQSDAVTIPAADMNCNPENSDAPCEYYIGVYSFTNSSFTVQATFRSEQFLQDGVPQHGQVTGEAYVYYKLVVQAADHSDLTLSLTPMTGSPRLYVSVGNSTVPNLPTATSRDWEQDFFATGGTPLHITNQDANWCASDDCVYYVGVYGSANKDAMFSVVATTSSGTISLQNGVPVQEVLTAANQWEYFSFEVPPSEAGADLTFVLTAISGDPDMYVDREERQPGTNATWNSRRSGSDAIPIDNAEAGVYYIGVKEFGSNNCTFSLTAFVQTGTDTLTTALVDGVPQTGVVNQGDFRFFRFEVAENTPALTITTAVAVGDPDLYIGFPTSDGNPTIPTRESYNESSTGWGADVITVATPAPGTYIIGVYGFSTSEFTLTAQGSESTGLLLLDGVAFSNTLSEGQYQYFQLSVDKLDKDLTVTVTSFNGDPDLFISTVYLENPTPATANWTANAYRDDSITIEKEDLRRGMYFIAIKGFRETDYTIMATFKEVVRLQDGSPQNDVVSKEGERRYTVRLSEGVTRLEIGLTTFTGSALVYIGTTELGRVVRSNPETYPWASLDIAQGPHHIEILEGDEGFCNGCTYEIVVYGTFDSSYQLVAHSGISSVRLEDGVAQRKTITRGEYAYFKFTLGNPESLVEFKLTALSGDPDIYVSTTVQKPTDQSGEYTWSGRHSGSDVIDIAFGDDDFVTGDYYIGITSYSSDATFTLMASVTDLSDLDPEDPAPLWLVDGQPQVGFLKDARTRHRYIFFVTDDTQGDLDITVTPQSGDPDLYVTDDGTEAGPDNKKWSSTGFGGLTESVSIPNVVAGTNYSISVEAFVTDCLYSITASLGGSVTLLEAGVPYTDTLQAEALEYFRFEAPNNDKPLTFALTVLSESSDADLYIASQQTVDANNGELPNTQETSDFYSRSFGSDTYTIPQPLESRTYYVGVKAFLASTFSLMATLGPVQLLQGSPQIGKVQGTSQRLEYRFLSASSSNTQSDLDFSVQATRNVKIYVNVLTDTSTQPGPGNSQWSTEDTGNQGLHNQVRVPASEGCSDCTYAVVVMGAEEGETSFSISASFEQDAAAQLEPGVRVMASVAMGGAARYYRAVAQSGQDFELTATAFVGAVDIFVSGSSQQPSAMDNDWTTMGGPSIGGVHLFVPADDKPDVRPDDNTYYIAVVSSQQATASSKVSLLFSLGLTSLADGVPQLAELHLADTPGIFKFDLQLPSIGLVPKLEFLLDPAVTAEGDLMMYVTTSQSGAGYETPTSENALWSLDTRESSELVIATDGNDGRFCNGCTYYLGVYGAMGMRYTLRARAKPEYDLLLDHAVLPGSIAEGEYQYFRMFAADASQFRTELQTCTGNADLYLGTDRTQYPTAALFDEKSDNDDQIDSVEIRDPARRDLTMYIGVLGTKASTFRIVSHSTDMVTTAPLLTDATLRTKSKVGGVEVSLTAAQSRTASTQLKYTVYYSDDPDAVLYSLCGLELVSQGDDKTTDADAVTFALSGLQAGAFYKFGVVVEDPASGEKSVYRATAGTQTLVEGEGGPAAKTGVIIGVLVPLLLIVVVCVALYLYCKNRKLKKEMGIEMDDVPRAVVRKAMQNPANRSKKYSPLVADEDEDDMLVSTNWE